MVLTHSVKTTHSSALTSSHTEFSELFLQRIWQNQGALETVLMQQKALDHADSFLQRTVLRKTEANEQPTCATTKM